MKRLLVFFILLVAFSSCKELEARRPISRSSGSYTQESIERNRDLIAQEEKDIQEFIKKDTLYSYSSSNDGFWYTYINKDETGSSIIPKVGDLTRFTYSLKTLNGRTLVSTEEIGQVITQIDQSNQELISGIRDGLKIMKEGETVIFLLSLIHI